MWPVIRYSGIAVVLVLFPVNVYAECPNDAAVQAYVTDHYAPRAVRSFGNDITLADAECSRAAQCHWTSQSQSSR